jgi:transcriptional regulator with XRE-family HTH domain
LKAILMSLKYRGAMINNKKDISVDEYFDNLLNSIDEDTKQSISISMAIATQINFVLKKKNISQRAFAALLGKKESEISKWLSGNHNFTTNTIGKIQRALGENIINVPLYTKKVKFIPIQSYSQLVQTVKSDNLNEKPNFEDIPIEVVFNHILTTDNCYEANI